uniref:Ovule protein n=1 Tax=Heterorhabditis bacteriophora TaxID=37862 RepID=A0A1I7XBS2_HETBA
MLMRTCVLKGDTRQLSRNKKNKKKVEEQQTKSDYKTTAFSVVKDNERDSQKAKHDPISKTSGHRIEDSVTSTNKKANIYNNNNNNNYYS